MGPLYLPAYQDRGHKPAGIRAVRREIGRELAVALPAWADQRGADPRRVVLAALICVLARYADADAVTVAVLGGEPGTLTVDLADDPPFAMIPGRLATTAAGDGDAAVAYQWGAHASADSLRYPLRLACVGLSGESSQPALEARYEAGILDRGTVERLLGHIMTLLAEATADGGDSRLSQLPLLTPAEMQQTLVDWNDTAADFGQDACLHQRFARVASAAPQSTALIHRGQELTFRAVDLASNRLAHHLRGLGLARGARVALCLERGPGLLIAILGVLKAGGAYVPLDPGYPAARLTFMHRDAACAALVSESRLLDRLPAADAPVVLLDRDAATLAACPSEPLEPVAGPDDLCYVIYTSGSTGRPKGIAVRHRGVLNNLLDLITRFEIGGADRVLALSSTSFDMSVFEFLGLTLAGGAVVVPDAAEAEDPACWDALIRAHGVTVWNSAPALLEAYLAHQETGVGDARGLRLALLGGDWVNPAQPGRLRAFAPGVRVIVMGGATESSIHSTIYEAESPLPGWSSIPYGRPMANQRTYILDRGRQPVPVGVPGELHLAGAGLARGYLGQPELTAEKFIDWSHGPVAGERLYRTGDLARFRPDGLIELLGRMDFQTKIRGLRVELGEIEAVLRDQPGVTAAAVVVRKESPGEGTLVGYVVHAKDGRPDLAELRRRVAGVLPAHMVPELAAIPELPLTPNGKLDRAHLAALASPARRGGGTPPASPVERELAAIWRALLGAEEVAREDRLLDLGGHSLTAMMTASRVRARLGVEITPGTVLAAVSLAELATIVERARPASSAGPDQAAERAEPHGTAQPDAGGAARARADGERATGPLSFAQERMWYLHQLVPTTPVYNVAVTLPWRPALDRAVCQRSLNRLIARHEALRTRFADRDGRPQQVVEAPWELQIEDGNEPAAEPWSLASAVRRAAEAPFDLKRGRLLRACLVGAPGAAQPDALVLTIHHIVCDGWTLDILMREFERCYAAECAGVTPDLPDLPVRYLDYAHWQRGRAAAAAFARDLEYWRGRLSGAPLVLDLPAARSRPVEQTFRGGLHAFAWHGTLPDRLAALAHRSGATLHTVLLAGFAALLARYTGQSDLVIGTPAAGRPSALIEPLAGLFVNTLPLRLDVGGDPDFRELLARVRAEALAAFDHQELPFEQLVEELHPVRDPGRMPVVQVMFQLNDMPLPEIRVADALLRPRLADVGVAKLDLAVTFERAPDGLTGTVEYNADIFDEGTVARLIARLGLLLEAVADSERVRPARAPLMDGAERHAVLETWNRTRRPYPDNVCVHELVEEWVRRDAGAPAVVDGARRLSYGELGAAAGRLAEVLRRRGVGRGARVGIFLERGADLVVAQLSVLTVGAAYVPVDPSYPDERLAMMARECELVAVVTGESTRARAAVLGAPEIMLDGPAPDGGRPEPAGGRASSRPGRASALDPAYVMFTSGSTGRPKGVVVSHQSIARLVCADDYIDLTPTDRVAQTANCAFDLATFEIWSTLANGACLVILPTTTVTDPASLAQAITEHGITVMGLTTVLFNAMARDRPEGFRPLRALLFGGEAADPRWVRRILAEGPPHRLVNLYGPTETTVFATCHDVRRAPAEREAVPIGRPIASTELYILDDWLCPVPPDVPGEVYLGGPGLALGYLNRPDLTAERFVPHPFAARPGARLYRTGDRARFRPDGAVEFLGRADAQVKLRGLRIEPAEIEAVLEEHPDVRQAAVTVYEPAPEERRLAAFIVPASPGALIPHDRLRAFLRRTLPDYMIPSAYLKVGTLPLSANGKTDRSALKVPPGYRTPDDGSPRAAAVAETSQSAIGTLCRIWSQVLGIDGARPDDDFFALGGHSLLAVRLLAAVNDAFGADLPLRVLLAHPSPRALAEALPTGPELIRRGEGIDGRVPLSHAQQRLWFMDQLEPDGPLYNVPVTLELDGPLDHDALSRALAALLRRHETLRTHYPAELGRPWQEATPENDVPDDVLDLVDLTVDGASTPDVADLADQITAREAAHRFDLAAGPVARMVLLRLAPQQHRLLLTFHHIAVDGWSLGVLLRELGELYAPSGTAPRRAGPSLPDPPLRYRDYAIWQRRSLADGRPGQRGRLEEAIAHWREMLGADPSVPELPADHPRSGRRGFRGAVVERAIGAETAEQLRALAGRHGATPAIALLAAFHLLLAEWTGRPATTVGTAVAGRDRANLRDLVGCFVNVLPVRVDLTGADTFGQALTRTATALRGALAYQDVPVDQIVGALAVRRSADYMPLFRVIFNHVAAIPPPDLVGLRGCAVEIGWPAGTSMFDLGLTVEEREVGLHVVLQHDTDLFERVTVAGLLDRYVALIGRIVADPLGSPKIAQAGGSRDR